MSLIHICTCMCLIYRTSQVALGVKNPPANAGDKRHEFDPWVGKIWRRAWQPTPVFFPGESHGQRSSLVGYTVHGVAKSQTRLKRLGTKCTAKSLQSCPTLCDPIDGSPPGSAVPGILQARTLEWVAISFSNS